VTGPDAAARVLVVNSGSSSLKYRLVEPDGGAVLARGLVERIGADGSRLEHRRDAAAGGRQVTHRVDRPFADHGCALEAVRQAFADAGPDLADAGLVAVGHRVVHGGERFRDPVLVDDGVLAAIEDLAVLAPLHNPANAEGIRVARRLLPGVPHVAVFDTAFHATIPARAATYAVPKEWRRDHDVRRYGFHGTSYAYVSREAARLLGRPPEQTNLVVLHLGNGASACAVEGGRSVDTSMGLTPLAGLVMGTRSGDVDPALAAHLHRVAGLSATDVDHALNTRSGLLGLAGVSDVREVTARADAGDPDALAALDVYCYRIRSYVGAYLAVLGRVDAVVFTAGVGENSAVVRARCLAGLERFGIAVDAERNAARGDGARSIGPDGGQVPVLVVPTDEEREIARQALDVARGGRPAGGRSP
jgi:acetate kinase